MCDECISHSKVIVRLCMFTINRNRNFEALLRQIEIADANPDLANVIPTQELISGYPLDNVVAGNTVLWNSTYQTSAMLLSSARNKARSKHPSAMSYCRKTDHVRLLIWRHCSLPEPNRNSKDQCCSRAQCWRRPSVHGIEMRV